MFGTIVINQSELKFREFDVYHSYYCGLCHALKRRYGLSGEITISYDAAFLVMLLSSLYEPETAQGRRRCVVHPLRSHETRENAITEYVADLNVCLAGCKCEDDWVDEHRLTRKLFGGVLRGRLERAEHYDREAFAKKEDAIRGWLAKLAEGERARSGDLDEMAGYFGRIVAELMLYRKDEWSDELYLLGFYLGKWIYLMDAYEDLEDDAKHGRYNPLVHLRESVPPEEFETEVRDILTMLMTDCCRKFEQLPLIENVGILRNILYSGVWTKYERAYAKRSGRQDDPGTGADGISEQAHTETGAPGGAKPGEELG